MKTLKTAKTSTGETCKLISEPDGLSILFREYKAPARISDGVLTLEDAMCGLSADLEELVVGALRTF